MPLCMPCTHLYIYRWVHGMHKGISLQSLYNYGSNQYSYMYSYGQIALAIARAITGHTRTSKSTDYCHNCTRKCVINYTNTK